MVLVVEREPNRENCRESKRGKRTTRIEGKKKKTLIIAVIINLKLDSDFIQIVFIKQVLTGKNLCPLIVCYL